MSSELTRSAKDEEVDLEWEYAVATAGPHAVTFWHRVRFNDPAPLKCWADAYYPDGKTPHGCFEIGTTDIGLCAEHYEEMIPCQQSG